MCVVLQKFGLVFFVVFSGMNIENELAGRLLDFSFATLNKGTLQGGVVDHALASGP